jgi:hypothetical protein
VVRFSTRQFLSIEVLYSKHSKRVISLTGDADPGVAPVSGRVTKEARCVTIAR